MKDLCDRLTDLASARKAANRLADVANTTRLAAARQRAMPNPPVIAQNTVYGVVPSGNGAKTYTPHITHTEGRYAWACTCPDAGYRGERVGPCKHAIVLALAAIDVAQREIDTLTVVIKGA